MDNKPKGFTLMEITVAIALFLTVVLLSGSLYILAQQSYSKSTTQCELVQNARVCLDRLSRELRQAKELVTVLASSTPTDNIFFQDGHNLDEITYIHYYASGTDMMRAHVYFYFAAAPDVYVYYDSVDIFENPPLIATTSDRVIGQYFDNIAFTGSDGLINVSMDLSKGSGALNTGTEIYIRNW